MIDTTFKVKFWFSDVKPPASNIISRTQQTQAAINADANKFLSSEYGVLDLNTGQSNSSEGYKGGGGAFNPSLGIRNTYTIQLAPITIAEWGTLLSEIQSGKQRFYHYMEIFNWVPVLHDPANLIPVNILDMTGPARDGGLRDVTIAVEEYYPITRGS